MMAWEPKKKFDVTSEDDFDKQLLGQGVQSLGKVALKRESWTSGPINNGINSFPSFHQEWFSDLF